MHKLSMSIAASVLIKNGFSCIQIGAGAGSGDKRSSTPDGFQSLVQGLANKYSGMIHLYEPNPACWDALAREWACTSGVTIWHEGVVSQRLLADNTSSLDFYFHPDDKPFYQVCSLGPSHVIAHYPCSTLRDLNVVRSECSTLSTVVGRALSDINPGVFLCIDVEGHDYDLAIEMLKSHLVCFVKMFSVEYLHLDSLQIARLEAVAQSAGFVMLGYGVDLHGWDRLFVCRELLDDVGLSLLPCIPLL